MLRAEIASVKQLQPLVRPNTGPVQSCGVASVHEDQRTAGREEIVQMAQGIAHSCSRRGGRSCR